MPVRHNYICGCGHIIEDHVGDTPPLCCGCPMEILWSAPPRPYIGIHPSERAIVWFDPKTGRHATPGRTDVPMPERYRRLGYERREFTTLRDLDSWCKSHNVVHERSHYNNGKSYDMED